MKTWHIWDFPDTVYVRLKDDIRNRFFREMFTKFGGKKPYARFLGISSRRIYFYSYGFTHKNMKKRLHYTPLHILKKSRKFLTNKLEEDIKNGIIAIRCSGGYSIKTPKLPIKESPELYRIAAHLIGDGSAAKRHEPYYCNSCKELRQQFKKDLLIFGKIRTRERNLNPTSAIMLPTVFGSILAHILKVKFTNPTKLPNIIWKTNKKNQAEFLKALYDDEGTISPNLYICMKSKNLMNEVKTLIESFGIESSKLGKKVDSNGNQCWQLKVLKGSYQRFYKKLGFYHPNKKKNLNITLKIQELSKNNRSKLNNSKSAELLRKKIKKLLSNAHYSIIEISRLALEDYHRVHRNIIALEKNGDIIRFGSNNKLKWRINYGLIHRHS